MAKRVSRRLVIDASVARSSGGEHAAHPTSKHCRDFCISLLKLCHRVVQSPDIKVEWNKHQSKFFRAWRPQMVARKKVCYVDAPVNDQLRRKIQSVATTRNQSDAMLKDTHLIEAAMHTDRMVVSVDETVRRLFAVAAGSIAELTTIVWLNPSMTDEKPIAWLNDGARPEKTRFLGYGANNGGRS